MEWSKSTPLHFRGSGGLAQQPTLSRELLRAMASPMVPDNGLPVLDRPIYATAMTTARWFRQLLGFAAMLLTEMRVLLSQSSTCPTPCPLVLVVPGVGVTLLGRIRLHRALSAGVPNVDMTFLRQWAVRPVMMHRLFAVLPSRHVTAVLSLLFPVTPTLLDRAPHFLTDELLWSRRQAPPRLTLSRHIRRLTVSLLKAAPVLLAPP